MAVHVGAAFRGTSVWMVRHRNTRVAGNSRGVSQCARRQAGRRAAHLKCGSPETQRLPGPRSRYIVVVSCGRLAARQRVHGRLGMATGADWRAGDAERETVAGQLREHYAAGRLTIDEFRARLDRAYSAITVSDLGRVTADLPAVQGPAAAQGGTGAAPPGPRRRARPAVLLLVAGLVAASVLAISQLPHGGLLVLALLLV